MFFFVITAFVLFCIPNYQNCFLFCILNIMFWFFNADSLLPGATVVVDVLCKNKSIHVNTKYHLFYQTRYYHGDDGPLASDTISKASSFLFADTLLFSRKHCSLVLGYFAASFRYFKLIIQLLEASVTDKVLVV